MSLPRKSTIASAFACSIFLSSAWSGQGETLTLFPSKDNTLFESPSGRFSNGAGDFLFAGRTNHPPNSLDNPSERRGLLRRAVVKFDMAKGIPEDAVITDAVFELFVSNVSSMVPVEELDTEVTIHRVASDWGEGTSNAVQQEGAGASAEIGDVTWTHATFGGAKWSTPGGDFDEQVSASASVGKKFARYQWRGAQMLADLQDWMVNPDSNHGWIVVGDESTHLTAKRIDSRTNPNRATRPRLVVTFSVPTEELSAFAISEVRLSESGGVEIIFPSKADHVYTVERSIDLDSGSPWLAHGDGIEGTGHPVTHEIIENDCPAFFRVVEMAQ